MCIYCGIQVLTLSTNEQTLLSVDTLVFLLNWSSSSPRVGLVNFRLLKIMKNSFDTLRGLKTKIMFVVLLKKHSETEAQVFTFWILSLQ